MNTITQKYAQSYHVTLASTIYTSRPVGLSTTQYTQHPRVELGTARTMLERVQRLACLAIAGPMHTTPTAAMEILLGLPPLDLYIKYVAMTSCYRLKTFGRWVQGSEPKGHMQITTMMVREAPTTMMKSDRMIST